MSEPMKIEIVETPNQPAPEPQKPIAKESVEPKYVKLEDLEKVNQAINNTRGWNERKWNEVNEKVDKILSSIPKPVSTGEPDLDELVQKDWKAGVKKVVEQVMSEQSQVTAKQTQAQIEAQILEESKSRVLERHKELNDPDHPKTKEFLKVLEENPDFKVNPRGPLLAAYEMENRLKSYGNIESGDTTVKETRARATSIPKGSPTNQKGSYSLSKQDMEFCKLNGINPESYKQYRGQREVGA